MRGEYFVVAVRRATVGVRDDIACRKRSPQVGIGSVLTRGKIEIVGRGLYYRL